MNTPISFKPSRKKLTSSASIVAMTMASLFIGGASDAVAQDTAYEDVIVVTGSIVRTKSKDFETPSPVQTLDQEMFANTGSAVIQDVFKGISANSGSQTSNRQSALQGVSQFSLRGLGIGSTLTLINGRRAGLSPVSDSSGAFFTDANSFPANMIERVEVLTDGASATYGSEAVAGVVNIITRKNFEGFELTGEYRNSLVDGYNFGAAAGHSFDRGHFSVFGTYVQQDGAFRSDLDLIRDADATGTALDDGRGDQGNADIGGVFLSGTGGLGRIAPAAFVNGAWDRLSGDITDPDCIAAQGIDRGDGRCRYPFIDQRKIIADEDRLQLFSQFDYELTDRLSVDAELGFSRNEITDGIGGAVLRGSSFQTDGGFLVRGGVVGDGTLNPYNFFINDRGTLREATAAERADPNTVYSDVITRQRPLGRAFDGHCDGDDDFFCAGDIVTRFDNLRLSAGMDYELSDNWFASASFTHSDNSYTRAQDRDYDGNAFQAAIDSGRWNPFGSSIADPTGLAHDGTGLGNTAEDLALFAKTSTDTGSITQDVAELIFSGTLGIELGGGDVSFAIGAQYRNIGFQFTPDARKQLGIDGRATIVNPIDATQDALAVFAEANLPVSDRFEMQLAARYEDHSDGAGSTFDPKVSAKFDLNDNIALRGSWGTSFQAPTIQHRNQAVGSAGIQDPNRPGDGQFNVDVIVGAPITPLKPQEASNFNIGAIFKTDSGLKASVDFFTYDFSNVIGPAGGDPQGIVDAIYAANGNMVVDEDGLNSHSSLPNLSYSLDGNQLDAVRSVFSNLGDYQAQGFDINIFYKPEFLRGLALNANTTFFTKYSSDTFAGLDGNGDIKGSRNFNNSLGSTPDFKANLGATYASGIHTANVTMRHITSYTDDQAFEKIPSQTTFDARYSIDLADIVSFGEGMDLYVGAVNIFDEQPPALSNRPLIDTEVHDPRGRQIYVGFKQSF